MVQVQDRRFNNATPRQLQTSAVSLGPSLAEEIVVKTCHFRTPKIRYSLAVLLRCLRIAKPCEKQRLQSNHDHKSTLGKLQINHGSAWRGSNLLFP